VLDGCPSFYQLTPTNFLHFNTVIHCLSFPKQYCRLLLIILLFKFCSLCPSQGPVTMSSVTHLEKKITQFTQALKRGRIHGSFAVSRHTAEIMRLVVATIKWPNARSLLEAVKAYGRRLIEAKPLELAIGNTVRRVLFIIREEYTNSQVRVHLCKEKSQLIPNLAGN